MAPRYAIYFTPPPTSPLALFGARILGVDADTGQDVRPNAELLAAWPDWHKLTAEPRRYRFHATLKAPFELASQMSEPDLVGEVARFASRTMAIDIGQLDVSAISGFIALTPRVTTTELSALSAETVRGLDHLRAPLTTSDRARRNPAGLTPRQRKYLDLWGYPHVLDEFRFHMTLTGSVEPDRLEPVRRMLEKAFHSDVPGWQTAVRIDALTICKQSDRDARFRILSRHTLAGNRNSVGALITPRRATEGSP